MIFQIDKTIYEQLSETERYIVDFISQNEDKISYLSITNIANLPEAALYILQWH